MNANLFKIREALQRIKSRADSGGRRVETAMNACDEIENLADAALTATFSLEQDIIKHSKMLLE